MIFAALSTVVDCGTPPEIDHGLTSLSGGTVLGSLVTYSCEREYVLDGISTRQCQENSQWSGQSPICKRMLTPERGNQTSCYTVSSHACRSV